MAFFSSSFRHRLFGTNGYNIPKPKFLYYVNFVSSNLPADLTQQLAFFVKRADRINLSYDIEEKNQYNKKRLVQTKINYAPLSFAFHDTTDSSALRMIEAYNRFYYYDCDDKNTRSWLYDLTGAQFEPTGSWGLKGNQTPNNQHFFDRVEIYEMYDQVYTKVSFINPLFSSIEFQQMDQELSGVSEVLATMQYEGIVVEAISQPMTQEVANLVGLPLVNDSDTSAINLFNVGASSLFQNLITGEGRLGSDIVRGSIDQAIGAFTGAVSDQFSGTLGGIESRVFGAQPSSLLSGITQFDTFETVSNTFESVGLRANAGQAVRDISTGFVDNIGDSIDSLLKF